MEINQKFNMKKIILDVSSVVGTNATTGIQRVAIELTKRFILDYENSYIVCYKKNKDKFYIVDKESFLKNCYDKNRIDKVKITNTVFKISDLNSKCSLVDIDSVYDPGHCCQRSILYNKLKKNNVEIVSLIHDVLPIDSPQFWWKGFYDNYFLLYLAAIFRYSDKILTTTNSTRLEICRYMSYCKINKKVFVVPLGSDLKKTYDQTKISNNIIANAKNKYILMVATFEPRKNHKLLFNAFIQIAKNTDVSLILAGRLGWCYEELIKKIKKHPLYNKRIFIYNNASNDEIIYLYKHAFAFVFPSFAEGYGLPIVEALYYNTCVFASDIPVFREITNGNAIFFNPHSNTDLCKKLSMYIKNGNYQKYNQKQFKVSTWNESYSKLKKIISI